LPERLLPAAIHPSVREKEREALDAKHFRCKLSAVAIPKADNKNGESEQCAESPAA